MIDGSTNEEGQDLIPRRHGKVFGAYIDYRTLGKDGKAPTKPSQDGGHIHMQTIN
jgi:hypothetical protein